MKIYKFIVNDQELESKEEKLVASDIIKMAQEKGVLTEVKPENLLLGAADGDKHQFKPEDWVDLSKYSKFILIPNQPTPVA